MTWATCTSEEVGFVRVKVALFLPPRATAPMDNSVADADSKDCDGVVGSKGCSTVPLHPASSRASAGKSSAPRSCLARREEMSMWRQGWDMMPFF
jgi:hypothetical protein